MRPSLLVVAKAPVPGRVKTRLGHDIGMRAAATLAAASLADTLTGCSATYGPGRCFLALEGSLTDGRDPAVLQSLVEGWRVLPQRGDSLAERIVNAHADVGALAQGPVLQVGMDTPQLTPDLLLVAAAELETHDAVLGPAEDGGWWVLGVRNPTMAAAITGVPMSTSSTGQDTRSAMEAVGLRVATTAVLRDVDTMSDARLVAALAPDTRFARTLALMDDPGTCAR